MKNKLLVGLVILGGISLAATWHSTKVFALSDTSSDDTASTATVPADTSTATNPDTAPVSQPDSSVASGSDATQVGSSSVGSDSTQQTDSTPTPIQPTDPSINQSGGSSTPQADSSTTQSNNTNVNNNVNGTSQSGDAGVSFNKQGGNATTGNSNGNTTVVNSVGSSDNLSGGGGIQTFTDNIDGTHNGNVIINPDQMLLPNGTTADSIAPGQSVANALNNTEVDNNINLMATSGNADVNNNGVGGNATTGNANTQANIINLIESLVSDNKSFVGVININGNLNGNIVLPSSLVNSLLSGGSQSGAAGTTTAINNILVNNSVSLTAISGTATVMNNGSAGNATSGNATTALNIYNLINSHIVGGNVLLVFVNVMGTWYGLLMNAPAGTTTAALGGGIQQDTVAPVSNAVATNNIVVNNVVNLWSQTGNASVVANGVGGNATTGDASASADIVNILGTQINLTGWLGILIINVFGTWNGSLVVQSPTNTTAHGVKVHHNGNGSTTTSANAASYAFYMFSPTQAGSVVASADNSTPNLISDGGLLPTKTVSNKISSTHDALFSIVSFIIAGTALATVIVSNKKLAARGPKV